jgi:hypothetical protein
MHGDKISFLKLYRKTSQAGRTYYQGRMNGLRLVGFEVEAQGDEGEHIELYVSVPDEQRQASPPRQGGQRRSYRSEGESEPEGRFSSVGASSERRPRRPRQERKEKPTAEPLPDDPIPFGDGYDSLTPPY